MKKVMGVLLCVTVGLGLFAGCTVDDSDFKQVEYTADGTQIHTIQIDVQNRKIEVERAEDENITISYYESEQERYDISASDDGTLVMSYQPEKEWTDYIGANASEKVRTIHLQIPDQLISNLQITTTKEDVSLPELTLTQGISVNVNQGDIMLGQLTVGSSAELTVKNGNITGTLMGSYDDFTISCQVKKGESNLPQQMGDGPKQLTVSANNGDVDIRIQAE